MWLLHAADVGYPAISFPDDNFSMLIPPLPSIPFSPHPSPHQKLRVHRGPTVHAQPGAHRHQRAQRRVQPPALRRRHHAPAGAQGERMNGVVHVVKEGLAIVRRLPREPLGESDSPPTHTHTLWFPPNPRRCNTPRFLPQLAPTVTLPSPPLSSSPPPPPLLPPAPFLATPSSIARIATPSSLARRPRGFCSPRASWW